MADAADLLRQFEGYRDTPYWDVNAWRLGYGTDTMTLADGSVVPVTKSSVVNKDDAERDLARRIPEFQQNGIVAFVGQEAWDALPTAAQAALTSLAYNYGGLGELPSLQRAVRAGDVGAIADAVAARRNDNGGVNAERRDEEAKIIRGAKPTEKATARQNIATQRAEQAEMRNRVIPPIPAPRPDTVNGKIIQPLAAPAPLNKNNPLQKPVDLAAGAKPLTNPRKGNFSTETNYAAGAGKGATGEVTYKQPAPASPVVPARRPDTVAPAKETPRQMVKLPSGKTVEVGRIYTINGEDFIGGSKGGVGTLTKAPTSIVEEAKGKSVAGEAVRQAVRDETGKVIRGAVAAAPQIASDAVSGISSIAGNVGSLIGNAFGGGGKPERSPALASALARLGATVATKAKIDLGQPRPQASATASGTAGARGDASGRLDMGKPGVIRTASAPNQQPIPGNVRPSSVPSVEELIRLQTKQQPTARQNIQTGRQEQQSQQPKYVTKTRQVLVESANSDVKKGASLAAGAGAAVGAGLKPPITISGGGTAMAGAKGTGGGALTYVAPKPVYRTETYQERNPLYVEPRQTLTDEQIAGYRKLAADREAARVEDAKRQAAAAAAASAPKISEVGGGGAYLTTPFQEDRFQTTTNALMPASTNNSRWLSGY